VRTVRTVRTVSALGAVSSLTGVTTMGAAAVVAGARESGGEMPVMPAAMPEVSVMPASVSMMAR